MTPDPHYKHCPSCRVEYNLEALRCADCDVELVEAHELEAEAEMLEDFPPASDLVCIRVAPIAWIQALSNALQDGGAPHRVEPATTDDAPDGQKPEVFGGVQLFGLYVQEEHAAETRLLDGSIAAQLLPDEAPSLSADEHEQCPACGSALGADALECGDCGLSFG